jgi:hypothetical protein
MPKEEFENWLDIVNNAEVVATMTMSLMWQAVADDKSKLAEESESDCTVQVKKKKFEKLLQPMPRCEKLYRFFVVVFNITGKTT